jgi:hypothetical protein
MRTSLIAAFFILGFFSTCYVSVTYAQEKTVTLPTDTSHSVLKPVDTTQTNQTVPLTNPLRLHTLSSFETNKAIEYQVTVFQKSFATKPSNSNFELSSHSKRNKVLNLISFGSPFKQSKFTKTSEILFRF